MRSQKQSLVFAHGGMGNEKEGRKGTFNGYGSRVPDDADAHFDGV